MATEGFYSASETANWLHLDFPSPAVEKEGSSSYLLAMPVDICTDEATAFLNTRYSMIGSSSEGNNNYGLDIDALVLGETAPLDPSLDFQDGASLSTKSSPMMLNTPDSHSGSTSISLQSPSAAVTNAASYWTMPYQTMDHINATTSSSSYSSYSSSSSLSSSSNVSDQFFGYTFSPNDFNASSINHPRTMPFAATSAGTVAAAAVIKSLRKQSESRISLPELYLRMGLAHDHDEARIREQRILTILKQQGFKLGEKTWIRDTTGQVRKSIIDEIYRQTFADYGYSKEMLELIVRRGSYYLMQARLRRIRRSKKAQQANQARQARAMNGSQAQIHAS